MSENDRKEISYEFQEAVTEVLAYKLVNAAKKKGKDSIDPVKHENSSEEKDFHDEMEIRIFP